MPLEFPSNLAPNFFHVDKLPDYGLKLHENELGREIRRFTETTGNKTELRVLYTGMRATEVNTLLSFYRDTKGTFEDFTLPTSFYLSPDEITNSLAGLDDTETWRFLRQPIIKTIISDIYQTEINLISLKEPPSQSSGNVVGFVESVVLSLTPSKITLAPLLVSRGFDSIQLDFSEGGSTVIPRTTALLTNLNFSLASLTTLANAGAGASSGSLNFSLPIVIPRIPVLMGFESITLELTQGSTGYYELAGWDEMQSTIVSGTFTSTLRTIHLVNTGSGVASTTLPSNAPDNSIIIYSDYAGTSSVSPTGFGLNSFTLNAPAGQTIQGQNSRVFNVENTSIQLIKKGTRWNIVGTELATTAIPESMDGQIDSPSNKTYTLIASARYGFTIENLTVFTTSGTCTVAVQINGVNVGALSGINVTSSSQTVNSTTAKTVTTGQRVTFVVSSNSSASELVFSLGTQRT